MLCFELDFFFSYKVPDIKGCTTKKKGKKGREREREREKGRGRGRVRGRVRGRGREREGRKEGRKEGRSKMWFLMAEEVHQPLCSLVTLPSGGFKNTDRKPIVLVREEFVM